MVQCTRCRGYPKIAETKNFKLNAKRFYPCKQLCPVADSGLKVIFKPSVPREARIRTSRLDVSAIVVMQPQSFFLQPLTPLALASHVMVIEGEGRAVTSH
ncbi:hypothetical protein J6590_077938 [Homalodisca vitripennis]|nr:hypothetical protein J6590_077938 [Homalodisca vitripennis]